MKIPFSYLSDITNGCYSFFIIAFILKIKNTNLQKLDSTQNFQKQTTEIHL